MKTAYALSTCVTIDGKRYWNGFLADAPPGHYRSFPSHPALLFATEDEARAYADRWISERTLPESWDVTLKQVNEYPRHRTGADGTLEEIPLAEAAPIEDLPLFA